MALALEVGISRQRPSKPDDPQSRVKHELSLMDIDDLVVAVLPAIKVSDWVMIARNPQHLALQYVMQLCEAILGMFHHFLLVMRGGLMVAVGNISTD